MTRLPGGPDVTPVDAEAWLRQIASMAVRIHDVQVSAGPFRTRIDAAAPVTPVSATRPAVWEAAFGILRPRAPVYSDAWRRCIPVQVAGRAPVDVEGMTGRVERLLDAIVRRI